VDLHARLPAVDLVSLAVISHDVVPS